MGEKLTEAPAADTECPVLATARIVSGKWTLLVLRDLAQGARRFSELERSLLGISPRTLSLRLRALEEEGIVERRTYAEVPPRVEYALTPLGATLAAPMRSLAQWSVAHGKRVDESRERFDTRAAAERARRDAA
jgi:DNA-binding HxlR family transcriptional regulator